MEQMMKQMMYQQRQLATQQNQTMVQQIFYEQNRAKCDGVGEHNFGFV